MSVIEYNSSWPLAEFKDVAKIVTGSTPSTKKLEYYGGEIPFVKPGDLKEEGIIVSSAENYVTELGAEQGRLLPQKSVMVCCIGSLGKVGFSTKPLITNQQINSLVFDESKVYPKYGYYYCTTIQPILEHIAPNTTVAIVNKTNFSKLKIPLPPLETQKKIAAVLDKADALRQKRRQTIEKLDELTRSVFLDMFGDPNLNFQNWPLKQLNDLKDASAQNGFFKKNDFYGSGTPIVWLDDFIDNFYVKTEGLKKVEAEKDEVKKYKLAYGDVLFCRSSLNQKGIGKAAIFPKNIDREIMFECHIIRVNLDLDEVIPEYFRAFSDTNFFRNQVLQNANTSTMTTISQKALLKCELLVPPKELQLKFVDTFEKIRNPKKKLLESENHLNELFNALLQKAFKGELNLSSSEEPLLAAEEAAEYSAG